MAKLLSSLTIVFVGTLLLPRALDARWESKADNKPEAVLEAMTDKELFNEAFDVCLRRAMLERQVGETSDLVSGNTGEASDYLGVIYQVAGKNHEGIAPSWMLELTAAHTVKKCQGAYRTFLGLEEPVPTPEKKAVRPVAKKRVAAPRHSDPLEQLPPWLVPQRPAPAQ